MPTTLSNRLRTLRVKRKLSQTQLARLSGVRRATISDWESSKVETMDFATLARVCEALGTSVNELMLLPNRTSKRAVASWEAAEDLTPPESAEEALELFERHATQWRRTLETLAKSAGDAERGSGWGTPPRTTQKQRDQDRDEAERSGAEAYVDQVLVETALARRAIKDGDASLAVFHALRAGHSHGSARTLMTQFERPRRKR